MVIALLLLIGLFVLLFVARVGGARRLELLQRWPALVLAAAALFAFARGLWPAGIALALGAGIAWQFWPRLTAAQSHAAEKSAPDPLDAEARAILGVSAQATPSEIRAAYRAKMARAHPDRGGTHAEAARLTAARDRLVGRKR
jgi:hypothetical protein